MTTYNGKVTFHALQTDVTPRSGSPGWEAQVSATLQEKFRNGTRVSIDNMVTNHGQFLYVSLHQAGYTAHGTIEQTPEGVVVDFGKQHRYDTRDALEGIAREAYIAINDRPGSMYSQLLRQEIDH